MKKQISALLLAAALSVSFAAGCGGKQPEETAAAAVVHADGEVVANDAKLYRVFVTDTEGKPVADAMKLTNKAVAEALDGLPAYKMHCSVLAEEAIQSALQDYEKRTGKTIPKAE